MATRTLALLAFTLFSPAQAFADEPEPAAPAGMEVQARGPIHEAFAEPTLANPAAPLLAPRKPPENVPEVPPDQKPDGANVQWIPGYWTWDDERKDFLWVSGIWRAVPPDRRWIPGYWSESDDGWQWVRGLWAPADQEELPYQPAPPASLDNGPSAPAPDDTSTYVPGNWLYQSNRYAWQPGYWQEPRPGAVWVPASYVWTPQGYVFVPGYWDYPLEDRGTLFAPVAFQQPLWQDPNWFYQPSCVVNIPGLLASLFVRPGCGAYYYGDYYGAPYLNAGYQPWYRWGPRYHDPLFGYYRWNHRGDPNWYAGLGRGYTSRFDGTSARPARTFAAQNQQLRNVAGANVNSLRMVTPLSQTRLARTTAGERANTAQHARQLHQFAATRARAESGARRGAMSPGRALSVPRNLAGPSHSPAATHQSHRLSPTPSVTPHPARSNPEHHAALGHPGASNRTAPHGRIPIWPQTGNVPRGGAPVANPHVTVPHPSRPAPAVHQAPAHTAAPARHTSPAPHAAPQRHAPAPRAAPAVHAAPQQHAPAPRAAPAVHAAPQRHAPAPRAAPAAHAAPQRRAPAPRAAPAARPAASHAAPQRGTAHKGHK